MDGGEEEEEKGMCGRGGMRNYILKFCKSNKKYLDRKITFL
jgi:hypothetical protein